MCKITNASETGSEITIEEALKSLIQDNELLDLQLRGRDGVIVGACRSILAARSPVFRSMLYGNFTESKIGNIVDIDYDSIVLRSIVQYSLTNDVEMLHTNDPVGQENIHNVLSLIDAANYFNFPALKLKAEAWACNMMEMAEQSVCLFFEEAYVCGCSNSVMEHARQMIRSKPAATLLVENAVAKVSGPVLEEILADRSIRTDEITMFRALQVWAEDSDDKENAVGRKKQAKAMCAHLSLERISPSNLCKVVEASGLASVDVLLDAFKKQALASETKQDLCYAAFRIGTKQAKWHSSGTRTFESKTRHHAVETLHPSCSIQSGLWKWSIQVKSPCGLTWIGVASTKHPIRYDQWLGKQVGGWVYGCNGSACSATGIDDGPYDCSFPVFRSGSVVTMTFDATEGVLSAAVDGGPERILFTNMREAFKDLEVGFIPAVSLKHPGVVEFGGMLERLE